MTELQGELIVSIKIGRRFGHDTTPLLLVRRHNLKDRFQPLVVKFRLYKNRMLVTL